jgi:choline transport protein
MANLNKPDYTIERWHCVLVTYLLAIVTALVNIFFSRFLNHISTFAVVFNVLSFFVVTITILACNDNKQSASFVFTDFQNETGFESPGMGIMIGLLQSFFGEFFLLLPAAPQNIFVVSLLKCTYLTVLNS